MKANVPNQQVYHTHVDNRISHSSPTFRNMKGPRVPDFAPQCCVLIGDVVGPFARSHIDIDGNHLAPRKELGKIQDMSWKCHRPLHEFRSAGKYQLG